MKNLAIKISFLSILVVGVAAVSAFGQTQYHGTIPFDFTARGTKMEAGDYVLKNINSGLVLWSRKGRSVAILGPAMNLSDDNSYKGKLTFVKNGDTYELSQVTTPDYNLRFKHTATEVNVAKVKSKGDTVQVNIAAGN